MGLNVGKGNMYSFITHTFNVVKGKCPHNCSYCYMKKWGNQPDTHIDKKEFTADLGDNNFIFVGSSCDLFAEGIKQDWILKTLYHCNNYDNKYLFQTKNPKAINYYSDSLPIDTVICTTIETNRYYQNIMGNCPTPYDRAFEMSVIPYDKYLTIEPIIDFDLNNLVEMVKRCDVIQVNIGADSGGNNLPEPPKEKILELISELKKFTTVKEKSNLKRLLK